MKFFKYVFPLIFAVMFSVPLIIYFVTLPGMQAKSALAQNGTKTTAYIYDYYKSYDDDEGEDEYKFYYRFEVAGELYEGRKSSKSYSYSQVRKLKGTTIEISYDPNTFESVEADYRVDDTLLIVGIIFEAIAVGAFITFISFVIKAIKRRGIKDKGVLRIAHFSDATTNTRINGQPYYNVKYYWQNDNGEYINQTSPADYTYNQSQYYSQVKDFEIKTMGKESVIFEEPFTKPIQTNTVYAPEVDQQTSQQELITCEYCGVTFKKGETRCPCCNGPVNYGRK